MFIIIATIFLTSYYLSDFKFISGSFLASTFASFDMTIEKCIINFYEALDDQLYDIRINYRIQSNIVIEPESYARINNSFTPYILKFHNGYDFNYCNIDGYIKPETVINTFSITCTVCNIKSHTLIS